MKSLEVIRSIYEKYWPSYPQYLVEGECKRHAFHLDFVLKEVDQGGLVVDIGGGGALSQQV